MASKITSDEREKMFSHWCEVQAVKYVARNTKRSQRSVRHYRIIDNWDERLIILRAKAQLLTDEKQINKLLDLNTRITDIRDNIISRLSDLTSSPDFTVTVTDLDRIIRLADYVKGRPDLIIETTDPIQALIAKLTEFDNLNN